MFYELGYPSRFEELRAYYPRFYWNVVEMMAVLKAGGAVLDDFTDRIEVVYGNCFIETADEQTVARLEAFLGISLNKSRSLEERRRFLISFFSGFGKLSSSTLKEMIKSYTGAEVEVTLEPFDQEGNNRLEIAFLRGLEETIYMSDILLLLEKKIPAHLEYRALCTYRYDVAVQCSRTNILSDHELSGMKPDPVLVGALFNAAAETASEAQHILTDHQQASDEAGSESGRRPTATTVGAHSVSEAATANTAVTAQAEHVLCGTAFAHQ